MEYTQEILKDIAKMGAMEVLDSTGLATSEISQRQAHKVYGRKFIDRVVAEGRLKPVSIGQGRTGTIRFSVADILAIRAADRLQAARIENNLKTQ